MYLSLCVCIYIYIHTKLPTKCPIPILWLLVYIVSSIINPRVVLYSQEPTSHGTIGILMADVVRSLVFRGFPGARLTHSETATIWGGLARCRNLGCLKGGSATLMTLLIVKQIWFRQLGWWQKPNINGKIKNVPNHQPVYNTFDFTRSCMLLHSFTCFHLIHGTGSPRAKQTLVSHLQMKDQGRKVNCRNDMKWQAEAIPPFACSSAWYLLP